MSKLVFERLISFIEATRVTPGRPHVSTVVRWGTKGVRGVLLETILVGGRRFTSHEAIERFIAAVTAAANGEPAPTRTPAQRQREHDRAAAELARDGI